MVLRGNHLIILYRYSNPSSPCIRRSVLTSENYRQPLNCVHDALLIREALSPLSALRGPGRTSRPSWIIILTPHTYSRIFPDFHPASRPSSLNPSAYWYDNCDFHPAGIWTVILLICNCYSVVKFLRLFRACVKHKTKLDACTYPKKTNFRKKLFFSVWISLCMIIIL